MRVTIGTRFEARDLSMSTSARPRILLVEDEATVREHLARTLSDDYEVETAGNGREALTAVIRNPPGLVITDIVMPDIDGIELLKTLRSTRRTQAIPVLLISGRAIDEQRIEGFKLGADGYLPKPYAEGELRMRIVSMLQSARVRNEAIRHEAIEQAEQKALADRAALLESITDAFYALDHQFRFTYLNRRALHHFGKPTNALLGRVLWEVIPEMRGSVFQQEYERAFREQCAVAFETTSAVSGAWLDVRAYPSPQGLAAYFRDISVRKRAEEQLREADRRKTEFLAILAHELRNPLAPLRNGMQIVKRAVSDMPVCQTVSMMDRQLTHLVRLVDDLLDLNRITTGKLALRRRRVLLTDVLRGALESSRGIIETYGHELTLQVRADDVAVDGDWDRLTQVFSNLLTNSAKYTDPGGRIAVTLERQRGEAVLSVEDNGIGILPAELERIFEMFSQAQFHGERTNEGLGIGLSLVRTLVQMHGGSVRAFSEGPGTGSRFVVRLPVAQSDIEVRPPPSAPAADSQERRRRVLVVDDNADSATSLALLLQMEECVVQTAADGEEAIQRMQTFDPAIIFMDIGMPHLDGVEAARRIRALPNGDRVCIVALTGHGQPADRHRTAAAGMDHHVVKPITLELLQELLKHGAEASVPAESRARSVSSRGAA